MSAQVAIVMGSSSDAPIMAVAEETLNGLGIEHETRVLSAHRTPDEVREWARGLAGRGVKVVIAISSNSSYSVTAQTNADGAFTFSNTPLGEFEVKAYGGDDQLLATSKGILERPDEVVTLLLRASP